MVQFSKKTNTHILGTYFFEPKLTRPKQTYTERTRRLAHLPSFCELVVSILAYLIVILLSFVLGGCLVFYLLQKLCKNFISYFPSPI